MKKKAMKYPDGGEIAADATLTATTGDPGGGKKKGYDPDEELRSAFNNKKLTLAYDNNRSIKDVVMSAAKRGNIDPAFLLSSAWQEGFNKSVLRPDEVSEAYVNASNKDKTLNNYPIDGFYNYGLDTFGNNYDKLKKYLPEGFDQNFKLYDAFNEKKEKIKTVAFKNNEDALVAKAAFLNYERDRANQYAKTKGITPDSRTSDYFTLAAYNGGYGNAVKIIDQYAASKNQQNFIDQGLTQQQGVHKNIYPRLKREDLAKELLGYKYGGRMPKKPKFPDGTEDPIFGNQGPQLNKDAKNVGIDVFGNANQAQVPINPDAPADQQLFAINPQQGSPNQQSAVVPLSQFYDEYKDKFGNTRLKETGRYVNDKGEVNTGEQQQQRNDQISADNLANAEGKTNALGNIEKAAEIGITAINSFFQKKNAKQQERKNLRKAIMDEQFAPVFNPYAEGNGSQAIYGSGGTIHIKPENRGKFTAAAKRAGKSVQAYAAQILGHKENYSPTLVKRANFARNAAKWHEMGGEVSGENLGIQVTDGGKSKMISSNVHSNPMVEFTGKDHDEGGIGLAYGGTLAEVEDKEVGWVDDQGGLNIFGKLKMPGTNMTFRKVAKDMAKQEDKVDGMLSKYTNILNNGNPADPYQETARSTAKVMFKSLDKQSKEIADKKEALASYQNLILAMTDDGKKKMKYGGRMEYADGGELPKDPATIQAIIDKYSGGKSPLKAEDFIDVSERYGVPLDLMLAQAIAESNIGTKGRAVRTKNIFNVGNTDDGKENNQSSWKSGLEAYARLIKTEYATDPQNITTQDILSNDFTRPGKGGRYATAKYTPQVARILDEINPDNNYTLPNEQGFKYKNVTFSRKDAEKLYKFVQGDEEHPLNNADKSDYQRLQQYLGIDGEDPYPKSFKQFYDAKNKKQYSSPEGLSPSAFYKDPAVIQALKDDKTFKTADDSNWGIEHQKVWDALPQAKKDELLQKSQGTETNTQTTNTNSMDYVPKYEPINGQNPTNGVVDTPYGPAKREATAFSDKANIGNGDRKRDYISPLAIEQIAPELLTIATNRRDSVPQLSYQPELKQTFDISYQLGRNENQSSFNQVAKIAEQTGNVDALSELAAQKYKADQQYNMQEVQGNAQQKLSVYGQNVDTLNDAKVKNLALIADQQVKQAQAKFNTRKEDLSAFTSIEGKVLQNRLENKTYNAYANLFKHYGFDKKGNVTFNPDEVVTKFSAGEAQQFGLLSAQQGANAIMNGDFSRQFKKVKNDDGSTTTTETLGTNKKIQEEYKTLKNQGFDDNIIGNMLRAKYPETISDN